MFLCAQQGTLHLVGYAGALPNLPELSYYHEGRRAKNKKLCDLRALRGENYLPFFLFLASSTGISSAINKAGSTLVLFK